LCGDDPQARPSYHFDLIGGNSTGAIIVSALAFGWRVDTAVPGMRKTDAAAGR
jgi:hypothetical protein